MKSGSLNAYEKASATPVCLGAVSVADTFFLRLRGLLGRDPESFGPLWITKCKQIHTHGMSASIDVVYVDAHGSILQMDADVVPGRSCKRVRQATDVVEFPAGSIVRLGLGRFVRLECETAQKVAGIRPEWSTETARNPLSQPDGVASCAQEPAAAADCATARSWPTPLSAARRSACG
ncbi:MAG: DUF192 domain-containing protein [Coriobacteriaceae bacterium]|nr:DUF192 domain-containing protein [Coriobacteriaceae bacterium]